MFSGTSTVSTWPTLTCHVALRCENCTADAAQTIYDEVRYSNLPVCADASGPAGDGGDPARPRAARSVPRARAGDRLRRRRQPAGDGGGHARASARSGWTSRRRPIAEAQRAVARDRARPTSSSARSDVRELTNGQLGPVRLRRRPRRLRLDPGGRARRAAGRRSRPRSRRTGSRTSRSTRSPAATSGACCATPASGTPATRSATAGARPTKAQELYRFLNEQRVTRRRHLRRAARARGAAAGRTPALPARARRPERALEARAGSRSSPATRPGTGSATSARPTSTACAREMLPDGRRAAASGSSPDGDRIAFENLQRPADRAPLPPERASATRARLVDGRRRCPSATQRLHWAVAAERRAARGRASPRTRSPCSISERPRAVAFATLRELLGGEPGELGGGAARRLPARAADAARRAAARGDASPASARPRRGWRAGRRHAAPTWSRSPTCAVRMEEPAARC